MVMLQELSEWLWSVVTANIFHQKVKKPAVSYLALFLLESALKLLILNRLVKNVLFFYRNRITRC